MLPARMRGGQSLAEAVAGSAKEREGRWPVGKMDRSTLVVHGRVAVQQSRRQAARDGQHGLQVMSFEQAAVRLAGGFIRPIDNERLRIAIQAALLVTPMGALDSIRSLPGMVDAAADTLHKVWRAGIHIGDRSEDHPRLGAIARLETAVLDLLPVGMLRPADIVAAALERIVHAPKVLGPIKIAGVTELSPCWRPLLKALAARVPVEWHAGPRVVPEWLAETGASIIRSPALTPGISVVSAATAYHETVEAMRWLRSLLASGVSPSDIAIAAASPAEYDPHFLAARGDANVALHFAHGVPIVATRDGQAASALADIVSRGLSQSRLRRLAALGRDQGLFEPLPDGWVGILPADAPLSTPGAWQRLLSRLTPQAWPDGVDHASELQAVVELLSKGAEAAGEIGESFLQGRALTIWRKALRAGPAASIDATLAVLRQDDGLDACVAAAWMPASALAAAPRRFVRLLGLNSSRWPRGITEDRLIPDHIIPTDELDPLPVNLADRRDFDTILATTCGEVTLSRARRDSDGRLLGRSPLLAGRGDEAYVRRNAVPAHAFSETDRLLARPQEFAAAPQAISASGCWIDWRRSDITAHDGLVRPDHPAILAILDRTQSASSLRRLLRNPLGFVWAYAFGWREPKPGDDPLVLDALELGDLVHMVLDQALRGLGGGAVSADQTRIDAAVSEALEVVAASWEGERPVPPAVIWRRTLDDVHVMAVRGLLYGHEGGAVAMRSYSEVPFGGVRPKSDADVPWDTDSLVTIPGTEFNIAGFIDRLDLSSDGKCATVCDYKTGRTPSADIRLNGGRELQRCLYGFAVKALLGDDVAIKPSLLYLRDMVNLRLDDPEGALTEVAGYLRDARASVAGGAGLPGPDTGSDHDDLAFALPANARATYGKRKMSAATERLGSFTKVWEAK